MRRPLPAPPRMRRGEISPAECMLGECVRRVARATRLSAQRQNADHIRLGGTFAAAYTRRALSPLTTAQSRIPKAWTPIPRPSASRTRERRSATPRRALAPCSPHPALPALEMTATSRPAGRGEVTHRSRARRSVDAHRGGGRRGGLGQVNYTAYPGPRVIAARRRRLESRRCLRLRRGVPRE